MKTKMNADSSMQLTLTSMEFECLAHVVMQHIEDYEQVRAECYKNQHDKEVRYYLLHHELVHNLYRTMTPRMQQLSDTWEPLSELISSLEPHGPVALA